MNCERCGKWITDQTHAIYLGRCVPCFRRLPRPRLAVFTSAALVFVREIVLLPYYIFVWIPFQVFRWLWRCLREATTELPFNREEIFARFEPYYGEVNARSYYRGLRRGFFEPSQCRRFTFTPREPHYEAGLWDGAVARTNPACFPNALAMRILRAQLKAGTRSKSEIQSEIRNLAREATQLEGR
jgi:hypothetical protein